MQGQGPGQRFVTGNPDTLAASPVNTNIGIAGEASRLVVNAHLTGQVRPPAGPKPSNPSTQTPDPRPQTPDPNSKPQTPSPKPQIPTPNFNPEFHPLNPKLQTPNPKPRNLAGQYPFRFDGGQAPVAGGGAQPTTSLMMPETSRDNIISFPDVSGTVIPD